LLVQRCEKHKREGGGCARAARRCPQARPRNWEEVACCLKEEASIWEGHSRNLPAEPRDPLAGATLQSSTEAFPQRRVNQAPSCAFSRAAPGSARESNTEACRAETTVTVWLASLRKRRAALAHHSEALPRGASDLDQNFVMCRRQTGPSGTPRAQRAPACQDKSHNLRAFVRSSATFRNYKRGAVLWNHGGNRQQQRDSRWRGGPIALALDTVLPLSPNKASGRAMVTEESFLCA